MLQYAAQQTGYLIYVIIFQTRSENPLVGKCYLILYNSIIFVVPYDRLHSPLYYIYYQNTHSINCTPLTATHAVTVVPPPELMHGQFLSPQTSQIRFSPISRGGINWSVCRRNSLGTLHFTHCPIYAFSRNWRKLDLRVLRRMNQTIRHLGIYLCLQSQLQVAINEIP